MKKVMFVEDDKFLVRIYQTALEKLGYEVKFLTDGGNVIPEVKAFKPDLLILDVILPKADGFEVLKQLRTDHQTKGQAVFILSALESAEDVAKAKALGIEKYLFKSEETFDNVIGHINKYLAK